MENKEIWAQIKEILTNQQQNEFPNQGPGEITNVYKTHDGEKLKNSL